MKVDRLSRRLSMLTAVLLLCAAPAWADLLNNPTFDANKPFPVNPRDLSCWIASAANMLAADHWDNGDVNDIFTTLKAYAPFQQPGGWRGGFQHEALNYALSNALNFMPGWDPQERVDVWDSWRRAWPVNVDAPRLLINRLLTDETIEPNGIDDNRADDPVGIAFHGAGVAHAVTAWGNRDVGRTQQLAITDSDDGVTQVQYFTWLDDYTLSYYGRAVTVDYIAALRDSDEPDVFMNGDDGNGAPDLPTPEPATLALLALSLPALVAGLRKKN